MWNACLQTCRNNRIGYEVAWFLRKRQTLRVNNSRILSINFQSVVFILPLTYNEIFKSALVYL